MTDRLFVYGTLAPGRPNAHVLADVSGTWEAATVKGTLLPQGWGAAVGYPGIVLHDDGSEVHGMLFTAEDLAKHWQRLDRFEGEGYELRLTPVTLHRGGTAQAHIYVLRQPSQDTEGSIME